MAVVCSTAVIRLEKASLPDLKSSHYVYVKKKKDRRQRCSQAFNHVILKKPHSKIIYLVYGNGKCVILSARSPHEIMRATSWICKAIGTKLLSLPVVKNVVYVHWYDMPNASNVLSRLFDDLKTTRRVSLEPELSPALIIDSHTCPQAKIMIFRTGKVNITGIQDFESLPNVVNEVDGLLKSYKN